MTRVVSRLFIFIFNLATLAQTLTQGSGYLLFPGYQRHDGDGLNGD